MSSKYWDKSWNPLKVKGGGYHCTKCSPGCLNCWAENYNLRFHNKIPYDNRSIEFVLDSKVLEQPFRRKIPTTYFVCDLCDLFHEKVPFEYIKSVLGIIALCPQHTILLLTKRIERAAELSGAYPDNVHLGVTICTQKEADEILPIALQIPGFDWISIEPMLEEIDLDYETMFSFVGKGSPDWVVVGCESGPKRRPCKLEHIRSIVEQCATAGVGRYVKQIEINGEVEHDISKFPAWARVRNPI